MLRMRRTLDLFMVERMQGSVYWPRYNLDMEQQYIANVAILELIQKVVITVRHETEYRQLHSARRRLDLFMVERQVVTLRCLGWPPALINGISDQVRIVAISLLNICEPLAGWAGPQHVLVVQHEPHVGYSCCGDGVPHVKNHCPIGPY
jgi:hypothetical protein